MDLSKIYIEGSGKHPRGVVSHSPPASDTDYERSWECPCRREAIVLGPAVDTDRKQWFQSIGPDQSTQGRWPILLTIWGAQYNAQPSESLGSVTLWDTVKDDALWHLSSPKEHSKGHMRVNRTSGQDGGVGKRWARFLPWPHQNYS